MSVTQHRQSLVAEDWHAALHHAHTDALPDRTLSHDKTAGCLQHDCQFIEGFARPLACAVVHAPGLADAAPPAPETTVAK